MGTIALKDARDYYIMTQKEKQLLLGSEIREQKSDAIYFPIMLANLTPIKGQANTFAEFLTGTRASWEFGLLYVSPISHILGKSLYYVGTEPNEDPGHCIELFEKHPHRRPDALAFLRQTERRQTSYADVLLAVKRKFPMGRQFKREANEGRREAGPGDPGQSKS